MGTQTIPTFGVAAPAQAAGVGQTLDAQGVPFDPSTDFYDPSVLGQKRDIRLVPGMGDSPTAVLGNPVLMGTSFDTSTLGVPGAPMGGGSNLQSTYNSQVPIAPGSIPGTTYMPGDVAFVGGSHGNPGNDITGTAGTGVTLATAMNRLIAIGQEADPADIQALQEKLVKAGYLDPTKQGFNLGAISGTRDPTYTAYYQLLTGAIRTGTNWQSILDDRANRDAGKKYEDALNAQKARQAKSDAALLPHTTTTTTTNLSDPLTAQGLLTKYLTNDLGRAPTTEELGTFTGALTTAQQQAPTTTNAFVDPTDPSAPLKSSTSTGGFDPNQFTENYINQNFGQEKDAVGAATGFYQAAMQTLGSSR